MDRINSGGADGSVVKVSVAVASQSPLRVLAGVPTAARSRRMILVVTLLERELGRGAPLPSLSFEV